MTVVMRMLGRLLGLKQRRFWFAITGLPCVGLKDMVRGRFWRIAG
jgi:hypothetical protein